MGARQDDGEDEAGGAGLPLGDGGIADGDPAATNGPGAVTLADNGSSGGIEIQGKAFVGFINGV